MSVPVTATIRLCRGHNRSRYSDTIDGEPSIRSASAAAGQSTITRS